MSTFLFPNQPALMGHEPSRPLGEAQTAAHGRPVATTTVVEVQHG